MKKATKLSKHKRFKKKFLLKLINPHRIEKHVKIPPSEVFHNINKEPMNLVITLNFNTTFLIKASLIFLYCCKF